MATPSKGQRVGGAELEQLSEDLVARYAAGDSIRTIADAVGRSYGFVQLTLKNAGVTFRSRGGARTGETAAKPATPRRRPAKPKPEAKVAAKAKPEPKVAVEPVEDGLGQPAEVVLDDAVREPVADVITAKKGKKGKKSKDAKAAKAKDEQSGKGKDKKSKAKTDKADKAKASKADKGKAKDESGKKSKKGKKSDKK